MKHISSMHPKPADRNEFFIAADNQFLAVRLTMFLTENLKEKYDIEKIHLEKQYQSIQINIATNMEKNYTTHQTVQEVEMQNSIWKKNSQKETITKEIATKKKTIEKEITTLEEIITTKEEDITI
ncbi:24872_t:CDS:2 [Gigaspora margarita]|uniref:24872_t:CDS:1 n=1 Tax=Gigaspora margarita TaxID=4874 RepID=A0ABN7V086_GIGMA|nr:24872_t:CDS:2 [Gigaspora margarita]